MKKDTHSISVIIPSTGRETLQHCLDAIKRQTHPPDELLIIQDTERLGIGATRNTGVAQASGDLIVFTDDDCIPPDNWLENLLSIMEQYNADVVGGTMSETDAFLIAVRKRRNFPTTLKVDHSGIVGNGANIIYKKVLLEECLKRDGYIYRKHKYLGEDIDLIWRLRQLGAKVVYTPVTVLHLRESTYMGYWKRQFIKGIGIAKLHMNYRSSKTNIPPQRSILWDNERRGQKPNWFKVTFLKVIGPFDVNSFDSFKDFAAFWLGEKIQGIGFLWGLFMKRRE